MAFHHSEGPQGDKENEVVLNVAAELVTMNAE